MRACENMYVEEQMQRLRQYSRKISERRRRQCRRPWDWSDHPVWTKVTS